MKILVTGGSGFIGLNLVQKLLKLDHEVINIDNLTYASIKKENKKLQLQKKYKFYKYSINNANIIKKILKKHKPEKVFHLAAESHVDQSITNPNKFLLTNIIGTYNMLISSNDFYNSKLANKNFKFIHVSTDEVYGSSKHGISFKENSPYLPNSPYSASKASSDHLVRAWNKTYGLPTVITNCSNNFGPYQHSEKFIPTIIHSLINNKKIPIYGKGKNKRDWIFVEDHVDALIQIMNNSKSGSKYNISTEQNYTNIDICKKIYEIYNKELDIKNPLEFIKKVKYVKDRLGHDYEYKVNSFKIKKELKWKPQTSLRTGLIKTVKWYIKNFYK